MVPVKNTHQNAHLYLLLPFSFSNKLCIKTGLRKCTLLIGKICERRITTQSYLEMSSRIAPVWLLTMVEEKLLLEESKVLEKRSVKYMKYLVYISVSISHYLHICMCLCRYK